MNKPEASENFIEIIVEINGKRLRAKCHLPIDRISYDEFATALYAVKNTAQREMVDLVDSNGLIDVSNYYSV